jgi:photosystem II protein
MASVTTPAGMGMRALGGVAPLPCRATAARASASARATTSSGIGVHANRRAPARGFARSSRALRGDAATQTRALPPPPNGDAPSDAFDGLGSLFNNDDVSEDAKSLETRLGRAAMLGFFFTTVGDVVTRGEGPLEQLRDEETYVLNHINPVGLVQDALGLAGFYVETVLLVWLCLAACFLLAVQNGLANPVRTYSSKGSSRKNAAKTSQASNRVDNTITGFKEALSDVVKEQSPYELFNGRLAMVGFALAVAGDRATGGLGPLEQLTFETGVPVIDAELFGAFFLFGVFFNVVATGVKVGAKAWKNGKSAL